MKQVECMYALSAGAYTATLYVMVNRVKRVGVHPLPLPARPDFSIMMECPPEIAQCHSLCTLWFRPHQSFYLLYNE